MAQSALLISAAVMGLTTVAVVLALVGGREWRQPRTDRGRSPARKPTSAGTHLLPGEAFAKRTVRSPAAWQLGFLLTTLGFAAVAIFGIQGSLNAATVAVAFVPLLALYLFAGVYLAARHRGRPTALATAEGIGSLGALLVAAIVVQLVGLP